MKKILAFIAISTVTAGTQAAPGNTINFQGEVAAQTCSVNVNGTSGSVTILLPTASTSELNATGKISKETPFTINITDCTTSTDAATYKTVFVANNVNTATGNLQNTGTAENVDIQILKPAVNGTPGSAIDFKETYTAGDFNLEATKDSASATYTAQYYAVDQAKPGTVKASVQYAVSYQ